MNKWEVDEHKQWSEELKVNIIIKTSIKDASSEIFSPSSTKHLIHFRMAQDQFHHPSP